MCLGVPGRVVDVFHEHDLLMGRVDFGGVCKRVCLAHVPDIAPAVAIAARPDVIFCSFGDMLRVPGSRQDLAAVKAAGGDVRIVYSPLDCLPLADRHPDRTVVFFAVGFETTAPANATAVWQAK